MEASDTMICNSRAYNIYKDQHTNNTLFLQQMNQIQPTDYKNLRQEYKLHVGTNPRIYTCNQTMNTRGLNATGCEAGFRQGYENYTRHHLNDFMLAPCQTNTWRNHVACDDVKCCQIHHQLFDNWTKRKSN